MINTLPLRLTILHLAQRFRIDGETFIQQFSLLTTILTTNSQGFNYTRSFIFRPENSVFLQRLEDSQDSRISFGDSNRMFKMCRQRPICRYYSPLVR